MNGVDFSYTTNVIVLRKYKPKNGFISTKMSVAISNGSTVNNIYTYPIGI